MLLDKVGALTCSCPETVRLSCFSAASLLFFLCLEDEVDVFEGLLLGVSGNVDVSFSSESDSSFRINGASEMRRVFLAYYLGILLLVSFYLVSYTTIKCRKLASNTIQRMESSTTGLC